MAERDGNLRFGIGAYVDKKEIEDAVDEAGKLAVKEFSKISPVKLSVDATTKFEAKTGSVKEQNKIKKLNEAQSKLINHWNKQFEKGFKSSPEYEKQKKVLYGNFKDLSKGRTNDERVREIRDVIGKSISDYDKEYKKQLTALTGFSSKVINNALMQSKKDYYENVAKKGEARANKIANENFIKNLAKGAGRGKASTPGSATNIGTRTSKFDDTYFVQDGKGGPPEILRQNDKVGTYFGKNSQMKQTAINAKKYRAKKVDKYTIRNHPDQEGIASTLRKADTKFQSGAYTKENAQIFANILLKELAKIQGGLLHGRPDTDMKMMRDQIAAVWTEAESKGETPEKTINKISTMLMNRFKDDGIIGITDGTTKGVVESEKHTKEIQQQIFDAVNSLVDIETKSLREILNLQSNIKKQDAKQKEHKSNYTERKKEIQERPETKALSDAIGISSKKVWDAINTQTAFDRIKNDEASVKQDTEIKKLDDTIGLSEEEIDVVETDKQTGFNSDMAAKEVTKKLTTSNKIMGVDQYNALSSIDANVKSILATITKRRSNRNDNGAGGNGKRKSKKDNSSDLPSTEIWQPYFSGGGKFVTSQVQDRAIFPLGGPNRFIDKTNYKKIFNQINRPGVVANVESERKLIEQGKHPSQQRTFVGQSLDTAKENQSFLDRLKDILTGSTTKVDEIMAANVDAQRKMLAERAETYGLSDTSKRTTISGDIVQASRRKNLYQSLFGRETVNPFKDLKLTEGIGIDTTAITDALQKAIENNMFNAQTGGWMNNIAIAMTGGVAALFQPSLEKSHSQADILNTALANERQAIQELLQRIQTDEDYLKAMEKSGKARFNEDGTLAEGSSKEAWTLFAEMENFKHNLRGVLADTAAFNEIIKASGGNMTLVAKRASFVAPELRKNNVLLQNMNAGLDKNGKALKFQRRSAEILNYAFQLMGRNIGQMVKGLLATLNPISLIKRAFSDFASYNAKWQRTLNVIKYNLRAILAPLMDKIAQTIVNIIGLVQSLANGIRSAFGYGKIDLFDQSAASAEKMKEELEAAANVTASFDELHDIGSDNSGANDLYGDIYTPQWTGLQEIFEKIGKTLGNIGAIVSGLDFWQWLAIGGAALAGFLVLKAILNWFSGKNPLQSVANGVQSLLTSVGWALLILSITGFVKALTAFVECMKSATWEDIVKTFVMLGGAFAGLVLTAGGLMYLSTALGMFSTELLGLAALVASFALLIEAIADFISVTKECTSDELIQGWATLAATLGTVGLVITGLLIAISGVGVALAPGILATAAMVASIALVIAAVALLVKALDGAGDDIKLILDGLANNVQAVGNTLIGVINAITNAFTAGVNAVIAGVSLVASLLGKNINVSYIPSLQTSYIPKYAKGTNYVPNDGLAYLHQGEAVIPKKYNQHLNSGITTEERDYMSKMMQTMQLLDNTMRQGITVKGEFKQKGSDLVAVVQKGQNRNGYQPLSNPAYAR